jgi:hypothetical protein
MPNPNPLAGVVPRVVHPVNDGETTITEYIEKIEGEVALDTYVKAQTSAPEVVKRITELENCLQRLATAALSLIHDDKHPELRAAAFVANWEQSRSSLTLPPPSTAISLIRCRTLTCRERLRFQPDLHYRLRPSGRPSRSIPRQPQAINCYLWKSRHPEAFLPRP